METLTKLCCSKLKNLLCLHPLSYSFEVRNCIQHIPNLARFREHIDDYIGGHCLKLSSDGYDQLVQLSEEDFATFLSLDSLEVAEESTVLTYLFSWYAFNPEERLELLPKLFTSIRFSVITGPVLKHLTNDMIKNDSYGAFKMKLDEYLCNYKDCNTKPRAGDKLILVVALEEYIIKLKCFDLKTKTWLHLTDVPEEYCQQQCAICVIDGKVILIGGEDGVNTFDRVIEYDTDKNSWRHLNNMLMPRMKHKICVIDRKIHVLNGWRYNPDFNFNDFNDINSDIVELVRNHEVLDLEETIPEWKMFGDVINESINRTKSVVEIKGLMYILGFGAPMTISVYDPNQNRIKKIYSDPYSPTEEVGDFLSFNCELVAHDDDIYVIGMKGPEPQEYERIVKTYHPDTGVWTRVANLYYRHGSHEVVRHHNSLYSLGGILNQSFLLDDAGAGVVDEIEVYDVKTDLWTISEEKVDFEIVSNACLIKRCDILKIIGNTGAVT